MPTIIVCAADAGCAETLIPVIRCLEGRVDLRVYSDRGGGAGARFDGHVASQAISDPGEMNLASEASLLLATTAGKRQSFAVTASAAARAQGAQVVWIETMYHAARTGLNRTFVPDHLVVLDSFAAAPYLQTEDGLPCSAVIHPLGQPALDELETVLVDRGSRRDRFRARQGLGPEEQVLAFFASSSAQVDPEEALEPLCAALAALPKTVLLPRLHPSDPRKAELERYLRIRCPRLVLEPLEEIEALRCADAVAVQFSTLGLKAVYARLPVIYLWTDSVRRHFAKGSVEGAEFPPIDQGAALVARNRADVMTRLPRLLHEDETRMRLRTMQTSRFPVRSNAAGAIAKLVLALVDGQSA